MQVLNQVVCGQAEKDAPPRAVNTMKAEGVDPLQEN
jgi:hypothetical protein